MSDIFKAELKDKKIEITIQTKSIPTLVTALKLLELQIDNMIIGSQVQDTKESIVKVPPGIMNRLRS